MKFGMSLSGLGSRHYPEVAEQAERLGFDSIWIPEHLVFPVKMTPAYSYTPDGYPPMGPDAPSHDPWVVLGAAAARTSRIRLATGIYILPLRHPVIAARSVLTLDRMSGGRAVLGLGVGWLPDEFDVVGESFSNRGRRTDEMIELLRKLWTDDVVSFHGDFYDIPPIKFEPKPVKRMIPIIVGGTSPQALRRAGRLGDGWIHHKQIKASFSDSSAPSGTDEGDWAQLQDHIDVLRRHRQEAGRAEEPFEIVAGLGSDLDSVRRCQDLGVTTCSVGPSVAGLRGGKQGFLDWMDQFAEETMPKIAA
jgi:probable F420-dependent oxidoreductase